MNWNTMDMHGMAPEDALEDLRCHLFELYGREEYPAEYSRIEQRFSCVVSGGRNSFAFGVDVAIRRQYDHETHGQRSNVVTIGEKRVWCTKNAIDARLIAQVRHTPEGNAA